MSASNSVHTFTLASLQAAQALLRLSLWPAAQTIWSSDKGTSAAALRLEDAKIANGHLVVPGRQPLSLERLAAKAHADGMITAVSLHTMCVGHWAAEADYDIPGVGATHLNADGLAVKYGSGASAQKSGLMSTAGWHFVDRTSVSFPPPKGPRGADVVNYASKGALVEVAVEEATGEVSILRHHSIMECGTPLVPELVSGQLQGGIAMGIGFALYEYLPPYEDGPGDGTWNWDRYKLPRASDVAVWAQTADILPPLTPNEPPKGIAELTMIAVIPAIANAVAHAIDRRVYDLPMTPAKVKEMLS